jgi:hypothetical protein
MDGTGLRFETMEYGGEYPDKMPQAIKLIDAEGRSCIYVPITQNGKIVDSQGFLARCRGALIGSPAQTTGFDLDGVAETEANAQVEIGEGPEPSPREAVRFHHGNISAWSTERRYRTSCDRLVQGAASRCC